MARAAFILGFALGGFFDGILLHQLLQWHHLLSGLKGEPWRDIRVQILADGAFHLLMYILAVIGLWLLWRHRNDVAARSARLLIGNLLIGFGVWHVADTILSHWLLGLHRIRMDVENPLFWDLLWLVIFGLAAGATGLWLRRRGASGPGEDSRRPIAAMMVAGLVSAAAVAASLPVPNPAQDGHSPRLLYFLPGTAPSQIFAALDSVGGRMMWSDPSGQVYLIDARDDLSGWQLYRYRALPVSSNFFPAACFRAMRLT